MGMQQILLILLSVIIVSISVIGAMGLFTLQAQRSNRSAIIQDMHQVATLAVAYFRTSSNMGGGDGNFIVDEFYVWSGYPLTDNENFIVTDNGRIRLQTRPNGNLIIEGWGTELGYDEEDVIRGRLTLDGSTHQLTLQLLN
ncbi:MAG: hypothetical protein K9N07_07990 [Candidatus Cloacimonetes bacterium]|nr:hypothetical protein [Candidatus Cloacimonadota bacterium]